VEVKDGSNEAFVLERSFFILVKRIGGLVRDKGEG
jgi:hypothetical protein